MNKNIRNFQVPEIGKKIPQQQPPRFEIPDIEFVSVKFVSEHIPDVDFYNESYNNVPDLQGEIVEGLKYCVDIQSGMIIITGVGPEKGKDRIIYELVGKNFASIKYDWKKDSDNKDVIKGLTILVNV